MILALLATAALAAAAHAALSDLQLSPPKTLTLVPSISRDILLADVDGDSDDDLIAIVAEAPTAVRIHLSDGAGGYAPGVGYPLANWGDAAGVADIDSDGLHDIVIANWSTYTIAAHRGDGTGAFGAPVDYPVLGKAFEIEVADYDGDHAPDIAVANFGGVPTYTIPGEVWVFRNDGSGGFGAPGKHVAGRGTWCVTSGGTDQDGDLDLLSTNRNTFDVSLFANLGNGAFAPGSETRVGEYPVAACLLDLDRDGALELAVPSDSWVGPIDCPRVLENEGVQFVADTVLSTSAPMWETAAGDADADGDEDLYVAAYGELQLFDNQTPQLNRCSST